MLYPAFLFAVMSLSHNRLRVWDRLYVHNDLLAIRQWNGRKEVAMNELVTNVRNR